MSQDMMGQLQQMLSDPEMAEKLKQALGSFGAAPEQQEQTEDATQKIKQVYEQINSGPDPRVSLLKALKPYMNHTRSAQVDTAVRLLGLTKMSGLFKELQ
ncbi:MAG: hypothetical protein E7399_09300 [Ruminococcaceae bacterium]|nr:hypothetical protein [Oscillospiraceae bacterium]